MEFTVPFQAICCLIAIFIIGLFAVGKLQQQKRRRAEEKRARVLLRALQLEQSYEHWIEHQA